MEFIINPTIRQECNISWCQFNVYIDVSLQTVWIQIPIT